MTLISFSCPKVEIPMPAKKAYPRNKTILVQVSEEDLSALKDAVAKSKKRTSVSTLAYQMMRRGSLETLVNSFLANQSSNLPTKTE